VKLESDLKRIMSLNNIPFIRSFNHLGIFESLKLVSDFETESDRTKRENVRGNVMKKMYYF
jgi:hypothetical protein